MRVTTKISSYQGSTTITALIVVGLVAIIISSLVWQQQLEIRQLENIRDQVQVSWLQKNIVDFSRLILKDDFRLNPNVDHLGEIWAIPIQESKVADFLKSQDVPEELGSTTLSANLIDAQSRFNLTTLWGSNNSNMGDTNAIQAYINLLNQLGLDNQIANQTVNTALKSPKKPNHLDDLINYPGYSREIIKKLNPYVVVLPQTTPINLNTCSVEIIMAIYSFLTRAEAERLVQNRNITPFTSIDDLNKQVNQVHPNIAIQAVNSLTDIKSHYWLSISKIKIRQRVFINETLINRSDTLLSGGNLTKIIWSKQTLSLNP